MIIFIASITWSQNLSWVDEEYKPYLQSVLTDNKVYSLDSIKRNGDTLFKVIEKNDDRNASTAILLKRLVSSGIQNSDSLLIDYFDEKQQKNYLRLHHYYQKWDTLEYMEYDPEGRLLIEQERIDHFCLTGAPYDEFRTSYEYDDRKLVKKANEIKWNYDTNGLPLRPYDTWVDQSVKRYFYEDGLLHQELHRSIDFEEFDDTLRTELHPTHLITYSYEGVVLSEIKLKLWDLDREEWQFYQKHKYYSTGDSTIIESSFWDDLVESWQLSHRSIQFLEDGIDKTIKQIWDKLSSAWINSSREFIESSEVDQYNNQFKDKWNIQTNNWDFHQSESYFYSQDTIVKLTKYSSGYEYKDDYLYDHDSRLIFLKKQFRSGDDVPWKLIKIKDWFYSEEGILLSSEYGQFTFYDPPVYEEVFLEYFWDERVGTSDDLLPNILEIFPNPVGSDLNIRTDQSILVARIYDLNARLYLIFNGNRTELNNLKPGSYLLEVIFKDGTHKSRRFIKL